MGEHLPTAEDIEKADALAFEALQNIRDGQVRSTAVRGYARRVLEDIDALIHPPRSDRGAEQ